MDEDLEIRLRAIKVKRSTYIISQLFKKWDCENISISYKDYEWGTKVELFVSSIYGKIIYSWVPTVYVLDASDISSMLEVLLMHRVLFLYMMYGIANLYSDWLKPYSVD